MGRRKRRERQKDLWVATSELPKSAGHPFYLRLSELFDEHEFDAFVEGQCEQFYAPSLGRPSLTPGIYFRSLLIGYFEGIDSERGVAWRLGDSLSLRRFLAPSSRRFGVPSSGSRHLPCHGTRRCPRWLCLVVRQGPACHPRRWHYPKRGYSHHNIFR